MATIGLQLQRLIGGTVAPSTNVIFDTVVNSFGLVSYNALTGDITIAKTGRYLDNWWVTTQSTLGTKGITFFKFITLGEMGSNHMVRTHSPINKY